MVGSTIKIEQIKLPFMSIKCVGLEHGTITSISCCLKAEVDRKGIEIKNISLVS